MMVLDPRKPGLDGPNLSHGLFGNGQGLHQHGDIAERRWHNMEIFVPFRVKFGHETVGHLDASLDKIARGAKVLQVRLTGAQCGSLQGRRTEGTTKSPGLSPSTLFPTSVIIPSDSWPRTR